MFLLSKTTLIISIFVLLGIYSGLRFAIARSLVLNILSIVVFICAALWFRIDTMYMIYVAIAAFVVQQASWFVTMIAVNIIEQTYGGED